MAGGTLPLLKKGVKPAPKPAEVPVFYPERLATQAITDAGTYFVQGKNLFSLKGTFIREAPEAMWQTFTPEEEAANRQVQAKRRAAVGIKPERASVPAGVLEISKENAKALAAEANAE
jgi:hypothetical protein